jgi:hypothetical protein
MKKQPLKYLSIAYECVEDDFVCSWKRKGDIILVLQKKVPGAGPDSGSDDHHSGARVSRYRAEHKSSNYNATKINHALQLQLRTNEPTLINPAFPR